MKKLLGVLLVVLVILLIYKLGIEGQWEDEEETEVITPPPTYGDDPPKPPDVGIQIEEGRGTGDPDDFYTIVDEMPVYPGGESELMKYLSSIQYPPLAKEHGIEGQVFVRFLVDKHGQVTDIEIARGADKLLNQACIDHIKQMPRWTPGKHKGETVKVQYIVPIRFKLD